MKHIGEDDLVLYHYEESRDAEAIGGHLEACARCKADYVALCRTLALVDRFDRATLPDAADGVRFGREMWARLSPRLESRRQGWLGWWPHQGRLAVPAISAVVLAAFLAGLLVGRHGDGKPGPGAADRGRSEGRILLIAIGDHLERSQRLLIEVTNELPGGGTVDLGRQRERAAELATSNRLYRREAVDAGDGLVAEVLEDLERTLLEIAHAPEAAARDELVELRRRIERRGILMKIRVLGDVERAAPARTETGHAKEAA